MTRTACPFCNIEPGEILAQNDLAFAIRDKFPVRALHSLILPKRCVPDVFAATPAEREAMHDLAAILMADIKREDASVGGFNFGSNIGATAGQKIFHAHLHLIPRRVTEDPPPPAR